MKRLAGAGLGLTALSKGALTEELEERKLRLVKVEGWPLRRELAVASHRDKRASRCLQQFLDIAARKLGAWREAAPGKPTSQ